MNWRHLPAMAQLLDIDEKRTVELQLLESLDIKGGQLADSTFTIVS